MWRRFSDATPEELAAEAAKWVRRARAKRRQRKSPDETRISALDLAPQPVVSSRPMKPLSLAVAEEEYEDKLIRVSSRAQVRALRKVRAIDH